MRKVTVRLPVAPTSYSLHLQTIKNQSSSTAPGSKSNDHDKNNKNNNILLLYNNNNNNNYYYYYYHHHHHHYLKLTQLCRKLKTTEVNGHKFG